MATLIFWVMYVCVLLAICFATHKTKDAYEPCLILGLLFGWIPGAILAAWLNDNYFIPMGI